MAISGGQIVVYDGSACVDSSRKWKAVIRGVTSFVCRALPSIQGASKKDTIDASKAGSMQEALTTVDASKRGTIITSEDLSGLLHDASQTLDVPVDGLSSAGSFRSEIVAFNKQKCQRNAQFAAHLAITHRSICNTDENDDAACSAYLDLMSRPFTWADEPELIAFADVLACPIIVYEHPVEHQFRLSTHVNPAANKLSVFLLRSNFHKEKSAHFQLMVPVVLASQINEPKGYGPMLTAAFSLVKVHPIRITVPFDSSHTGTQDLLGFWNPGRRQLSVRCGSIGKNDFVSTDHGGAMATRPSKTYQGAGCIN